MVIRSQQPAVARIVSPEADPKRPADNPALRPRSFDEYVGQRDIVERLRVAVASAKIRREPLEHVLFYGPPGLGKTTLANIVAHEMAAHLRQTSGPACQKPSDLVSILTGLKEGDILFIDEIHRLPPALEEICYSAMEDRTIDIMIGSGTGATSVTMGVAPFTLIGATTRLSSLSSPLRDRFGNILKLDLYDEGHLAHIAARSFGLLWYPDMPAEAVSLVARRGRGTPRIVNRYVKILRDYATIGRDIASPETVRSIFSEIGVDDEGLDGIDRQLLSALARTFAGRAVGLGTLAAYLGEEADTVEDVIEPYLLKKGYMERTPAWRRITQAGEDAVRSL